MQYLWKYIDDLVGKGLDLLIILELLFYASATFVALAAPLAILLSSLMTFGSMGEQYEIIALKAAGVPIKKLILSLSLLILLIAGGTFWFSDHITPKAYLKMRSLLRNIIDQKPTLNIKEGEFYDGFDNYVIRVGRKDKNNKDIYDILLFDHTKSQGNTTFTYAKKGKMEMTDDKMYMLFYLYDGFYWDESSKPESSGNNPLTRSTFAEQYIKFDISSFVFEKSSDNFYNKSTQALSNAEIVKMIDTVMISIEENNNQFINQVMSTCYFFNEYIYHDTVVITGLNPPKTSWSDLNKEEKVMVLDKTLSLKNDFKNSLDFFRENNKYYYNSLASYLVEWYKKYVFTIACMLFFFIGAPLGSIIRRGGIGIPLVITVSFFTSFFFLTIFGERIAKGGAVPVWVGMGLSTFILIPICTFLIYQTSMDSALFSSEEIHKKIQLLNPKKLFTRNKK